MGLPVREIVQCPHCWASNPAIESRCRECDRPLAIYIGPPLRAAPRIGLGAGMIVVAVAAVCLAVGRLAPVPGIIAGLIATLALIRAHGAIGSEVKLGERPSTARRASLLGSSFGVASAIVLTTGFYFVCVSILLGGLLAICLYVIGLVSGARALLSFNLGVACLPIAGVVGLVAAIYVARGLCRELWEVRG